MTTQILGKPLDAITVVLHRPQDATNVGAVIRAMKNMGISDLRLVQPEPFDQAELLRVAHRCEDLVAKLGIYADLDEALAEMVYVVGTAALAHRKRPQTQDVRTLAGELVERSAQGRVALLFGEEADGLDHHALDRCHLIATLPSNPAYPALNLAQSVLLLLYEVRMAVIEVPTTPPVAPPAQQQELEQLFSAGEAALQALDFFKYSPALVMRTLRQIAYRIHLTSEEAALLAAIARKIARRSWRSANFTGRFFTRSQNN